jgi:pyridoxine/pyridoxamine 5'-phosphate oxidase
VTSGQTFSFSNMTWLHQVKRNVLQSQMMDIKTAHLKGHPKLQEAMLRAHNSKMFNVITTLHSRQNEDHQFVSLKV